MLTRISDYLRPVGITALGTIISVAGLRGYAFRRADIRSNQWLDHPNAFALLVGGMLILWGIVSFARTALRDNRN